MNEISNKKSKSYKEWKEIFMLLFPKVLSIYVVFCSNGVHKSDKKFSEWILPKEACAVFTEDFASPQISLLERMQIEYDLIESGFYTQFLPNKGFNLLDHLHGKIKEAFIKQGVQPIKVDKMIEKKEEPGYFLNTRELLLNSASRDDGKVGLLIDMFNLLMNEINLDTRKEFKKIAKQMKKIHSDGASEE